MAAATLLPLKKTIRWPLPCRSDAPRAEGEKSGTKAGPTEDESSCGRTTYHLCKADILSWVKRLNGFKLSLYNNAALTSRFKLSVYLMVIVERTMDVKMNDSMMRIPSASLSPTGPILNGKIHLTASDPGYNEPNCNEGNFLSATSIVLYFYSNFWWRQDAAVNFEMFVWFSSLTPQYWC